MATNGIECPIFIRTVRKARCCLEKHHENLLCWVGIVYVSSNENWRKCRIGNPRV